MGWRYGVQMVAANMQVSSAIYVISVTLLIMVLFCMISTWVIMFTFSVQHCNCVTYSGVVFYLTNHNLVWTSELGYPLAELQYKRIVARKHFLCLFLKSGLAQGKYWIVFKKKALWRYIIVHPHWSDLSATIHVQGHGRKLWLTQGMFRANGGCGYVKKPDILMNNDPDKLFDPTSKLPVKTRLKVNWTKAKFPFITGRSQMCYYYFSYLLQ